MICKVCGFRPENKPRFCPSCGSYFIDAEAPDDSHEWKGIITEDGTVISKGTATVSSRSSGKYAGGHQRINAWSILAICFPATLLLINIIDFIADEGYFFLGIPFLVLGIIACRLANREKFKWIGILLIALSVLLFAIRVLGS